MLKKILIIGIVCFLILPLQTVLGISHNIRILDEEQFDKTNVDPDIVKMIDQINEEILLYYLEKFVSFGFKEAGSENANNAAEWIKSEFEEIGLYTYFDHWKFPKYKDKNVIAINNGTDPTSDAVILICAHYDTAGESPGAIDDGTGIALMLAIANITKDASFNHTLRFIAAGCEEKGCYGSFADAKKAYWNDENIITVFNIDCIGFDNTSENNNIVQLQTSERSYWLFEFFKDISEKYKSQFDVKIQLSGFGPGDQESYKDYGYDVVAFIQAKPEMLLGLMHTPNDTIDKVNFTYLKKITKLILAATCELSIKPINVQVRIVSPKEGCIYIGNLPVKLPGFNLHYNRLRAITYINGITTVKINLTSNEDVNSVYFGIDGCIRHLDNEAPYEYIIGKGFLSHIFKLRGHHRLTVYVMTCSGKVAYDEMDIFFKPFIFKYNLLYRLLERFPNILPITHKILGM
jgi:hypothetical protein